MRVLTNLDFKTKLPDNLKKEFYSLLHLESVERIYVISWLGLLFFILFLFLDYQRYLEGKFEEGRIYTYLFYSHLTYVLYLIPLLVVTYQRSLIEKMSRGLTILAYSLLLSVTAIGLAVLVLADRNNLILYIIFIFVSNWALPLNHAQRAIFNLTSFIFIVMAVLRIGNDTTSTLTIRLYEAFGFTIFAFLFNTFDLNLRSGKFLNGKLLESERKRIEELEKFKSGLYTNLTHEFRTPLTVIRGMIDQAREDLSNNNPEDFDESLEILSRNSNELLNLINQMLDLAKLESKSLVMHPEQMDLVNFVQSVVMTYQPYAERKNIVLSVHCDIDYIEMDLDEDRMLSIIQNLISNAIKFTPEGGQVTVRIVKRGLKEVSLIVEDSGIGISGEHLPLIFDRFYQVESVEVNIGRGTGIGLALTRELVEIMGGSIQVDSQVGLGSQFEILLPITRNAPKKVEERSKKILKHPGDITTGSSAKPLLLIVEDHQDVQKYLATILSESYTIEQAYDGLEGYQKALSMIPDMILSDIMMPKMDGTAMIQRLKEDPRTDHIPIIALTAKADKKDKLDGIRKGADAYITKPFEKEELLVRIKALLDIRKKLHEKYRQFALLGHKDLDGKEGNFIININKVIEMNLLNQNFGVEDLAHGVHMSRMQLHRKLKAIANRSASNYIRSFRLNKAKTLLKDLANNISDVAYDVGFGDPNYFSKSFHKEFGITPSDFRQN
ncbi:MAG: response regulator [Saprospiraceae bacterium]|nr:response regulator [Saprospiraceae bacterium]